MHRIYKVTINQSLLIAAISLKFGFEFDELIEVEP